MSLSLQRIVLWYALLGAALALYAANEVARAARRDEAERARREQLLAQREEVLARAAAKQAAAEGLVAGRLSLPQAAARFRDLNAGDPPARRRERLRTQATDSEEVCACREAIAQVRSLPGHAPEQQATAARLEEELARRLSCGGLRLPAAGATGPARSPCPMPWGPDTIRLIPPARMGREVNRQAEHHARVLPSPSTAARRAVPRAGPPPHGPRK
jgi:hypothetical protein